MSFAEGTNVTVIFRAAITVLFLYINLHPSVMLESLMFIYINLHPSVMLESLMFIYIPFLLIV